MAESQIVTVRELNEPEVESVGAHLPLDRVDEHDAERSHVLRRDPGLAEETAAARVSRAVTASSV
jgi:hypothetical protein